MQVFVFELFGKGNVVFRKVYSRDFKAQFVQVNRMAAPSTSQIQNMGTFWKLQELNKILHQLTRLVFVTVAVQNMIIGSVEPRAIPIALFHCCKISLFSWHGKQFSHVGKNHVWF